MLSKCHRKWITGIDDRARVRKSLRDFEVTQPLSRVVWQRSISSDAPWEITRTHIAGHICISKHFHEWENKLKTQTVSHVNAAETPSGICKVWSFGWFFQRSIQLILNPLYFAWRADTVTVWLLRQCAVPQQSRFAFYSFLDNREWSIPRPDISDRLRERALQFRNGERFLKLADIPKATKHLSSSLVSKRLHDNHLRINSFSKQLCGTFMRDHSERITERQKLVVIV